MRSLFLVLVGALLGAGAVAAPSHAPKSFHVGIGPARNPKLMAATASGGSLTVSRGQVCTQPDGSGVVTLIYKNASNVVVVTRTLSFPVNRTNAVTDQFGNIIAATVPSTTGTSIDSFGSELDTQIGNAATAGKINL